MKRTITYIRNKLIKSYSHNEIEAIIDIMFNNIYNYSKKDLIVNANLKLPESEFEAIQKIVARLAKHEPIQYIFKKAYFYDLEFMVNPHVLIPRQETEELVDLILKKHGKQNKKLLDIGTGSGCIPITLKKNSPSFDIFSCDISNEALLVAKENARLLQTELSLIKFDILSDNDFPENQFDIIVSNPPYVTEKEKQVMLHNVLDFEPHLALFVSNNDPLLFYRTIIERSKRLLNPEGYIYFEINEAFGSMMKALLVQHGFSANIIKDLNGKDRIAAGHLKPSN